MYPITAGGRFFTTIILFVGLGLVAVPAGIVSSALSEARRLQAEDSAKN
jgi:voltage-gated potassium channel